MTGIRRIVTAIGEFMTALDRVMTGTSKFMTDMTLLPKKTDISVGSLKKIIHLNQPFSLKREMASIRFPTSSFSRIVEI